MYDLNMDSPRTFGRVCLGSVGTNPAKHYKTLREAILLFLRENATLRDVDHSTVDDSASDFDKS